jgi:hypothetical protein
MFDYETLMNDPQSVIISEQEQAWAICTSLHRYNDEQSIIACSMANTQQHARDGSNIGRSQLLWHGKTDWSRNAIILFPS